MTETELNLKEYTVEFINDLVENSYAQDDIYDFIEQYGEDNFVTHYEDYVEFGESYCYEAVDAYIGCFGIGALPNFGEAYRGQYESKGEFAEEFVNDCYSVNLPGFLAIDWEETFDNLDFIYEEGFVFDNN